MPCRMHMVDQRRPDREDSIPPTMEEQRSFSKLADMEIEMDISIKLPPRMPDVLLDLTNRQHQRRKLQHPDSRMSDR